MSRQQPVMLEPVFQEKIWGGERLKAVFGYGIPSSRTGVPSQISSNRPHAVR